MKPRLILVLLLGGVMAFLAYRSKYQTFFFADEIWRFLIFCGVILFVYAVIKDVKNYRLNKQLRHLSTTITAVIFIIVIQLMKYNTSKNFNKPSLLKVFYSGDFNGTAIDFKRDGTYIFDNSSIGQSDYLYGTYQITGNKIIIDKNDLDNVVTTSILEIRDKQVEHSGSYEKYLYQLSKDGQVINNATEFRVVVDNRFSKVSPK
jgi:hypothetical protein